MVFAKLAFKVVVFCNLLIESRKDWLLQLLLKCSEHTRDLVIMTIWRIWQFRNDITHGKGETPVHATVDYLDSYYKSLHLARKFTTEEIIKGKMPIADEGQLVSSKRLLTPVQWPRPPAGDAALSVEC